MHFVMMMMMKTKLGLGLGSHSGSSNSMREILQVSLSVRQAAHWVAPSRTLYMLHLSSITTGTSWPSLPNSEMGFNVYARGACVPTRDLGVLSHPKKTNETLAVKVILKKYNTSSFWYFFLFRKMDINGTCVISSSRTDISWQQIVALCFFMNSFEILLSYIDKYCMSYQDYILEIDKVLKHQRVYKLNTSK